MHEISHENDLRLDISYKQILGIAFPISASILVPQINFITNNIFLSRLGETEMGAAGITGVFYLVFGAIGFGLNNGIQALIARRAGENNPNAIGLLFAQGMRISLIIAIIGILTTYFLAPFIFDNTLQHAGNKKMVMDFLKIRIWGLPFLYLYQMRNALLVGTNQGKYLIIGTLAETITNIVLDYGLIFGNLGLPALGFNGAAYASIIAEAVGMIVIFSVIHLKGISSRFKLNFNFGYDKVQSKLILIQSSPLIFQYAISIIGWEFFFILIERNAQHPSDLGISNLMRNIFGLFGVSTWAFGATSSTMVSNIVGQKRHQDVLKLLFRIMVFSTGFACFVSLILNIFPFEIMSIYQMDNDFLQRAVPVLRVVSTALVIMSFAVIWMNAVVGTGNSKVNLQIELVAVLVYSVYNYLVFEIYKKPITWGWASEWIYWSIMFILAFLYLQFGKWKNKII